MKLYYFSLLIVVFFASCTPEISTLPMGVFLENDIIRLAPGESVRLNATILPEQASNKNLSWKSDNAEIAAIEDGVLTAGLEGTTVITVTTNSGQKTATCIVIVAFSVREIMLDRSSALMIMGERLLLTPTIFPEDAPDQSIKWESNAS